MRSSFNAKLQNLFAQNRFLSVGMDTDPNLLPSCLDEGPLWERMLQFNISIIDATADFAAVYKINTAFYEAGGEETMPALKKTIDYIRSSYPDVVIILDCKRGDIGNTNLGYVAATFKNLDVDAITIAPYMGYVANKPFLEDDTRGVFILCKTSNEGADEFQGDVDDDNPLYLTVASNVSKIWNRNGNAALVVGATYPAEMALVRQAAPDLIFLIPGVGAQGGGLEKAVRAGMNAERSGFLVNSSRAILYASKDDNYATRSREVALETHNAINAARQMDRILAPTAEEVAEAILAETNAVLTGHFVYNAGGHGPLYINKDAIYVHPDKTETLCALIAEYFKDTSIDTVIGPEKGGIILAQYVAKHLKIKTGNNVAAIYAEKSGDGFAINRGYDVHVKGKNVLIVEDILNSGKTVTNVTIAVNAHGGNIVGVGALCNRGGVTSEQLVVPVLYSLRTVVFENHSEKECPLCAANVPVNINVGKGAAYLSQKEKELA